MHRELWGDYGAFLIHGMSHVGRVNGCLQLARTGPYIPPLTLLGLHDFIVTDDLCRKMKLSNLGHFTFRPVIKSHIVECHWELWNLDSDEPAAYPWDLTRNIEVTHVAHEPEDYVLSHPHSSFMADQLGPLWEVVFREGGELQVADGATSSTKLTLIVATWNGDHLFLGRNLAVPDDWGLYPIVDETGKAWLERNANEWLYFEPIAQG